MKRGVMLNPSQHMARALHTLNLWTQTILLEDEPQPDYAELIETARPIAVVVGSPPIYAEDYDASGDEEFLEAITTLEPELFLLETVRGLGGPRFKEFFEDLIEDLEVDGRYKVGHGLVNLGGRTRLVIVGINSLKQPVVRNQGDLCDGADTLHAIIRDNLRRI